MDDAEIFTRERIETLLAQLAHRLAAKQVRGELFVVGGAAMALAYNADRTTSDIDAIVRPRNVVIDEAVEMARIENLDTAWLNDAVLSYVTTLKADKNSRVINSYPNLSVLVGSPEYILAMKAMVSRKSPSDLEDAAILANILGLKNEMEIESTIRQYIGSGSLGSQELWLEDIAERAAEIQKAAVADTQ